MAVTDALDQWRSSGRAYVSAQVDTQLAALGKRLTTSSETLHAIAKQLSDDPNLAVFGPLVTRGATQVERFVASFGGRDVGQLWRDAERFARSQPWLATLAATAAGFGISRAVKASAKRSPDGV